MNKKRKLKPWARMIVGTAKVAAITLLSFALTIGIMSAWTDAHYAKLAAYAEVNK